MGKVSIIAAIAFSFLGYILLQNMQQTSRETDVKQDDYLSGQIARELAIKGRKLLLANWISAGGASISTLSTINENGGVITMNPADFSISGDILDFKVRGAYNGAVHDIRSRFQFVTFGANPLQVKAPALNLSIDPNADLNINMITLDDQALNELETILIDELGLGESLGDFGLGFDMMQASINQELIDSGNDGAIGVSLIEEDDRLLYDAQNGMFFPDQVQQAIQSYIANNAGADSTINNGANFPAEFGISGPNILRVKDDVSIPAYSEVSGAGVLIVEGNLIIEDNAIFNWDGLILVTPPASNLNPQINFIGESNINGSIVILQDAIPNSGHMDVTAFRDLTGLWLTPHGTVQHQPFWPWWLFHTHDYTSQEGNSVVFYAPTAPERVHEDHIYFDETLQLLDGEDNVRLELENHSNHGRGILTYGLKGKTYTSYPVAAGFDPSEAESGNSYQTKVFKVKDLDMLQLDITRLSSLKKMWDNTETPFPGCNIWGGVNGAICVGESHTRQDALTLRLYKIGGGPPKRIYETALYWHRQEAEEDDFEDEMEEFVETLNSSDFGVNLSFGDSTTFTLDPTILQALSGFSGGNTMGMHNLGTWHRHWEADDPGNPLHIVQLSDD